MSLKTSYAPYFKIGAAISGMDLRNPSCMELVKEECSTFTCENDMKPMFFLDREANQKDPEKYEKVPAMKTDQAVPFLEFAKQNQIPMRGHTLVWHNQTPNWFFYQKYDEKGELADRETMLSRLDSYIHYVLDFVQTQYPGIIYAWDVVNEAIDEVVEKDRPQTTEKPVIKGGFRESLWLKTVGKDFVQKAFESARKYAAPEVKLFYNDYETAQEWKRDYIIKEILVPLKEKGLVDGMGMQSHLLMNHPDMKMYRTALHMYGALGLEVQITELDMHNADPSEASMQQQAQRYRELFELLLEAKKEGKANVTSVTFWNLLDETTWLTGFRREKSYPLLFSAACGRKEAYYQVLEAAGAHEEAEAARKEKPGYFAEMAEAYERERRNGIREVAAFLAKCEQFSLITAETERPVLSPGEDTPPGPPIKWYEQLPKHSMEALHLSEEGCYIRADLIRDLSKVSAQPGAEILAPDPEGGKVHLFGQLVCGENGEDKEQLYFDMVSAFFVSASMPPRVLSF